MVDNSNCVKEASVAWNLTLFGRKMSHKTRMITPRTTTIVQRIWKTQLQMQLQRHPKQQLHGLQLLPPPRPGRWYDFDGGIDGP